jgi:hypothetical protein
MGLPDLHLTITGGQLSDLFFNYEHPSRDSAVNGGHGFNDDAVLTALNKDAEDFLRTMGLDDHAIVDLSWQLARDCMERT